MPGVEAHEAGGLLDLVQGVMGSSNSVCVVLREDGRDVRRVLPQLFGSQSTGQIPEVLLSRVVVVVGDSEGFTPQEQEVLSQTGTAVRLGGLSLLASQCITVTHYLLDETLYGQ